MASEGEVYIFFRSYLTNRQKTVHFHDTNSKLSPVTLGVPQGSVLGLILFSVYMNDLPLILHNFPPVVYADDTTLIYAHESVDGALRVANE